MFVVWHDSWFLYLNAMAIGTGGEEPPATIPRSYRLSCGGNYPSRYSLRVSDFAEAAAAHGSYSHFTIPKFIVRHARRTTLVSLVIVLVSGGLIPQASTQDAVMGIAASNPARPTTTTRAHEFSDASIVVRWSQLAQDNAFAIDPAMIEPFPNARGWDHDLRANRGSAPHQLGVDDLLSDLTAARILCVELLLRAQRRPCH